jgi:hypothetical protein
MDILNFLFGNPSAWGLASGLFFILAYTWTIKLDDVDDVMASHVNLLQTEKLDRDGAIPMTGDLDMGGYDINNVKDVAGRTQENMLTNSGFGVWSNSDANKGLATLVFDNKAGGNFAVGNTITGATSGATGKLITTDNATTMTLGAVSGTFQDNEQISNGAGVTADVNGDTAIGIKNDPMNNDSTGLWTDDGVNITLAFVAAEYSVTTDAATQRAWIVAAALTAGKLYKIELDIKDGTAASQQIEGYLNDGVAQYGAIKTTAAGWVSVSWTFECATTTAAGLVGFRIPVSLGGLNIQIRRFSCYEITSCCTAADDLAFDGWIKSHNLNIYRQHNDGGIFTKEGNFYALKLVPCAVTQYIYFPGGYYLNEEWVKQFVSRTVSLGIWAKTSMASHFRIRIFDGLTATYSSYHTGGGSWEWIEITKVCSANGVALSITLFCDAAPNVNGSTIVYVSQPMLVLGSSIGAGNYRPRQQERILLEKKIPSNLLHGKTSLSDVAVADLNLEADSSGMLSKGCKEVKILTQCNDAGSAGTDCYLRLRANAAKDYEYYNSPFGKTNDAIGRILSWQQCDESGDIDYNLEASGANTFDVVEMVYCAVQVN